MECTSDLCRGAKWPPTREQSHFFDSTSPHHWHGFFAADRGKKTSESKKRSTGGKSVRIRNSMNAEFGIQILEPDHCFVGTVAAGVTKLWRISKKRLIQIEWPAQDFKPWEHTLLPHSQATPREVHGCKMCKTSVSYWHAGPFRRGDSTIFCEKELLHSINLVYN